MYKTVIVMGGAGFLGQNIVRGLKEKYQVFICDRYEPRFEQADKNFVMDIYQKKLNATFNICVHLIDNKVSLCDFRDYEEQLARHLVWHNISHLILMSSSVLYANPESEYGKRKRILEEFWNSFCIHHGIKLTILRLFNVFGPYHIPFSQGGLIANIMFNYLSSKPTEIYDLSAKRTFVFSKDVARVFSYVIENNMDGCYDIAGNNCKSIAEVIKILQEQIFGNRVSLIDHQKKEDIFCPKGNPELIAKVGETPFVQALKETYNFYFENLDKISHILAKGV